MKRLDQLLVEQQLVRSRSRAQRLIRNARVQLITPDGARTLTRPAERMPGDSHLVVLDDPEERYVSRAGLKLEALIAASGRLDGLTVLDVGQSTGGFSDCALRHGARRVIGIEVGHGQLDVDLAADERVTVLEGVNARRLPDEELVALAPEGIEAVVMDVSFISQTLILPELSRLLRPGARLLSLVKPQFELSPAKIAAGGLVRDTRHYAEVETRLRAACAECGFEILLWMASPISGGDGNREFLLHARRL
nr:TlyA family RNA methyltransferase [Kushneria aurantia]